MGKNRVGKIFPTNNCGDIELIEHKGKQIYDVRFSDGTIVKDITFGRIIEKTVKNPNEKNIYNVACIGEGVLPKDNKIAYKHWINMIQRVYCEKYKSLYPTYKNTSVSPMWLVFKEFLKWFENNYVENWVLDKDIIGKENKIYSPETCIFVPAEINALFRKHSKSNTGLQGVTKVYNGKFYSKGCGNYIGTFDTIEEAVKSCVDYKTNKLKNLILLYDSILPLKTKEILENINFNIYYL